MLAIKNAMGLVLAIGVFAIAVAQENVKESDVSPASKRYRAFRLASTEPTFGLAKVKALIRGIKPDAEDNRRLPGGVFNGLSAEAKFTYCMLHGEDASQNCDAMPWVVDEERKIFAYPPGIFNGEAAWSERQTTFLKSHRSEVVRLLRQTIKAKRQVGVNLKETIVFLQANELVPDLIASYQRDRKDQDVLSTLMLLMKNGKYPPFLASSTYRKLYGPDANYQASILANAANQKLTIDRAMGFYRSRVR